MEQRRMEEPTKIINIQKDRDGGLYLGNWFSGRNYRNWKFTRVINITQTNASYDIPHMWIDLLDHESSDLLSKLESATDYIYQSLKNGHKVLVHCQAGISRSATIVIAFVMRALHKDLDDALDYVKMKRPVVNPNRGFLRQLELFERQLKREQRYYNVTTKHI